MSEAIPLSDELLAVMRNAAAKALDLGEAVISERSMLLALLEEPSIGAVLAAVLSKDRLLSAQLPERTEPEDADESRDTLAFKTPDGSANMWLGREAYQMFAAGAQRVEDRYFPKHLAFGIAAEAARCAGTLAAIRVAPGALIDAIYKL